MIKWWLWFSLAAMLANTAKVLYIKLKCTEINTWTLIFYARLLPTIALLIALFFTDYQMIAPITFWLTTLMTAGLTLLASIFYINAVKTGYLSIVVPLQATIPLFMIACTGLLYQEIPKPRSLLFIGLIVISVAITLILLNKNKTNAFDKTKPIWTPILFSIAAAFLFGISTVFDRIAIAAVTQGAIVYSAYWHLITTLILIPILYKKRLFLVKPSDLILNSHKFAILIYAILALTAFILQQFAVQYSLTLDNGVTYVKSIVMIHISLVALSAVIMLKERMSLGVGLASIVTFISGIGLIY